VKNIVLLIAAASLLFAGCLGGAAPALNATNQSLQPSLEAALESEGEIPVDDGEAGDSEYGEEAGSESGHLPLAPGRMVYCVIDQPVYKQEFYFASDDAIMITTAKNGGWEKSEVDRSQSCAWNHEVPKQCVPVEEAGGFDGICGGWLGGALSMGSCDSLELDASVFAD
jgi:hypothetical protein